MLSEDVLVEIFDFYVDVYHPLSETPPNAWHTLVHVCRRWRYLVFASPHGLNLRLEYEGHQPMSKVLDAWPVLPVILISGLSKLSRRKSDQQRDNRLAALESEHYNRICEIYFTDITNSCWERFAAAMQKPFPELIHLDLSVNGDVVPVLPDSFLGGPAPRLRALRLRSIPFPSMPKLLLSADGLVTLYLEDIPDSGYISPDAMATALTVMTRLESLYLEFRSPRPRPDTANRPLPPSTRFSLPVLNKLTFKGVHECLEDLLARIDAPLLYRLHIVFFMDLDFDVPQLRRLISHAEGFKAFDHAKLSIADHSIQLLLHSESDQHMLELQISCRELDYQLSSLVQVLSSSFPLISTLEELEIKEHHLSSLHWKDDMENAQWLEVLEPFTSLKNLYLTDKIPLHVCDALQERSGERVTLSLRNIFISPRYLLEGSRGVIKAFVAARRPSGHPVSVHRGSWSEGWEDITEDLAPFSAADAAIMADAFRKALRKPDFAAPNDRRGRY